MSLERLKLLRENKSISQKKLAEKLNISQNLVHKWETGSSSPDPDTLKKIAVFFDVTVDYLIENDTGNQVEKDLSPKLKNIISDSVGISEEGLEDIHKYVQLVKLKERTDKKKDAEISLGHESSG